MFANHGSEPSDEATFNAGLAGIQEISGIRKRLNSFVEELESGIPPHQGPITHPMPPAQITPITRPLSVAVPLYIYPDAGRWDALHDVISRHEEIVFNIIVNPANGPGGRVPDSNYIREVARLNSKSNCKLFGYVHVSWGERDLSLVHSDILTWSHWKAFPEADLHVQGIFVDEAPAAPEKLDYMTEVYHACKDAFRNDCLVWTNPGVQVDAAYYHVADLVNCCENTYAGWQTLNERSGKSTAMLHTYPRSSTEMELDLATLQRSGYSSVLITTESCYTSFSTLLEQFVRAIENMNRGASL